MNKTLNSLYRKDIDGLRAVSIIAVLINHFNKQVLPSGYLGVDIFFVISGFVITSSLSNKSWKNFSDFILSFYEKRLKRILPALIAYLTITSIFITLLNDDPTVSLRTGIFSLFGISNIYLFKQSTYYFGQASELNPFLQTWSLGVEEQFYLIFPFLFWFTKNQKIKFNFGIVIILLTTISFLLFAGFYKANISATYFLMPFRFWEISVGSLLFIFRKKIPNLNQKNNNFLTCISFSSIIFLFFLSRDFAVLSTFLIVIFTSILISYLKVESLIYKLITFRYLIYIGLISYSLYLWHWGILSLGKWILPHNQFLTFIQIFLSFLISILSYELIEKKFRYYAFSTKKFTFLLSFSLISFFSYFIILIDNFQEKFYLPRLIGISKITTWGQEQKCNGKENLKKLKDPYKECLQPFEANDLKKKFYVIGDSHAMQFVPMIEKISKNYNSNLFYINNDQIGDFPRSFWNYENAFSDSITLEKILTNVNSNDILIISFHRGYLNSLRDTHISNFEALRLNKKEKKALKNFEILIYKLNQRNVKVIFIKDITMLARTIDISVCNMQDKLFGYNSCDVSKEQDSITRYKQDRLYKKLKTKFSNVYLWDPREEMVYKNNNLSFKDKNNKIIMIDQHHITKEFSNKLSSKFENFLIKNNLLIF